MINTSHKKTMQDLTIHNDDAIYGFINEYRFLSNYCYTPVELDDLIYPTSEHAYMAQKTDNKKIREFILKLETPKEARIFGQTIKLIDGWDSIRLDAMYKVLTAKFKVYSVRLPLIRTGNKYLEETNNWGDTFWGVCNGVGENNLGKLLMKVRNDVLLELKC